MPKRYFCEYCWKSFQDTSLNRQKHLKGGAHQRNKRQYYETVIAGMAATPPADQASVLYSGLSGEEILQQWLAKHPEVVQRHQKMITNSNQLPPSTSPS